MVGKSSVTASAEQRSALLDLALSNVRSEADRARAILLTLEGWTSADIAQAFGVRDDTVRFWRSQFGATGAAGMEKRTARGTPALKAEAALRVAADVLSQPVTNRINWTLPRLIDEIERREGLRISRSRLSIVLRQKGALPGAGHATP